MIQWKLLPATLLVLALAACGAEQEDAERAATGQQRDTTASEPAAGGDAGNVDLAEQEEALEEPSETSRDIWALIQEEHSELTGEQQRAMQACAEIKLRDQDITVDEAVQACREELEELAEEQEEEDEEEEGEGGDEG